MLNIDYKKLLDINYIKILNDILIISLLIYHATPQSNIPNFILNFFKFKAVRFLFIGLLFIKGQQHPDTVIFASIWYILILGKLSKQHFFETFSDNLLEEADAKKREEEKQAERTKLINNLNLAKLSAEYAKKNLQVADQYAEQTSVKSISIGDLLDETNDKLDAAKEAKDEELIKTLEKIQKSLTKIESLATETTDKANGRLDDFKNTLNDSNNKVKETEKELVVFENEDEEEMDLNTYQSLEQKAEEKLEEAKLAKYLEGIGLEYYNIEKKKVKSAIQDVKILNRRIFKNSNKIAIVEVLRKIRNRRVEIRNDTIKNRELAKIRYENLKLKANNMFEMTKLDYIELKKYDIKGNSPPSINKEKEIMIDNYKISIVNNLKTKESLILSKNYLLALNNRVIIYSRNKKELSTKISKARQTKNKVLIDTLEKMQDSTAEIEEAINKEIALYNVEMDRIKDKNSIEVNNINKIVNEFKNKFNQDITPNISIDEAVESDSNSEEESTNVV